MALHLYKAASSSSPNVIIPAYQAEQTWPATSSEVPPCYESRRRRELPPRRGAPLVSIVYILEQLMPAPLHSQQHDGRRHVAGVVDGVDVVAIVASVAIVAIFVVHHAAAHAHTSRGLARRREPTMRRKPRDRHRGIRCGHDHQLVHSALLRTRSLGSHLRRRGEHRGQRPVPPHFHRHAVGEALPVRGVTQRRRRELVVQARAKPARASASWWDLGLCAASQDRERGENTAART